MKHSRTEYRITVKRAGRPERAVIRCSEAALRKYLQLLGPEPWQVYAPGSEGDDLVCCRGGVYDECGCGGLTLREAAAAKRAEYSPLQWVRVESRRREWTLTPWSPPTLAPETTYALAGVVAFPDEPDRKWDALDHREQSEGGEPW